MTTKVLSNPVEDLKGLNLKAVVPNPKKLLIYIEDELVLDYDGTDTMQDEWHALHYKGKDYDLHIYYEEWSVEDPDANVILYALEDIDDLVGENTNTVQTDHSTYLCIPIEFGFDPRTLFMKQCSISQEWYEEDEGEEINGKWIAYENQIEDDD